MNIKMPYRPEIDGLRGFAVISVVLYHFEKIFLDTSFFQGGFLGVDIFFVISGYLISSLIFKELKANKDFSFINFYLRRIRRILPVLAFVILISSLISINIFIPEKLQFFFKSATSSWLFLSNFFFWRTSIVYNSEDSINIPLLHTWSLSIEEQFYAIFPLFIFIVYKFFRNKLIALIYVLAITSLIIASVTSMYFPTFNFYSLPTRIWELLFGSIIAYYEIFKNHKFKINKISKIFITVTVCLSLLFIKFGSDEIYHPSLITLVPVMSSVFIICFCRQNSFFISRFLRTKFLVFLGLISYSLYLWHYPLFVFLKNLNFNAQDLLYLKYLVFFLSFIISIFTFYFIEKPIRKKSFKLNYLVLFLISFSL